MQNQTAFGSTFILFSCLLLAILMCAVVAINAPANAAPTHSQTIPADIEIPSTYGRIEISTAVPHSLPAVDHFNIDKTAAAPLDAALSDEVTVHTYHSVFSTSHAGLAPSSAADFFTRAATSSSDNPYRIPEPSTIVLTLVGIAALRMCRRRKA